MKVDFKLKTNKFFKKYGKIILIGICIWISIILINQFLKLNPRKIQILKSYNPDKTIIDDNGFVPNKYKKEVKKTIDEFFNYCNNKEYEKAYNMLTEDCQEFLYNKNINNFKTYVKTIYNNKKIYNIQNYSNVKDIYIYNINILEDVETTGTSGGYDVYTEKISLIKQKNKKFKIANQGYIKKEENFKFGEDNYMKMKLLNVNYTYRKVIYKIEITNKTDKTLLFANSTLENEITLKLGSQKRKFLNNDETNIFVKPLETNTFSLIFDKFYDDKKVAEELSFNTVRLVKDYRLNNETEEKVYSYNLKLK